MKYYCIALKYYSMVNIILCSIYSIIANIFPSQMIDGKFLNTLGRYICGICVFLVLIMGVILYLLIKPNLRNYLDTSILQAILFWIFLFYAIYTIFKNGYALAPIPTSIPIKVFISIGAFLNMYINIIVVNILKHISL